jgi:hypothetical protein
VSEEDYIEVDMNEILGQGLRGTAPSTDQTPQVVSATTDDTDEVQILP